MDYITSSLGLEVLDRDLYRSKFLWTPRHARGTFGGQLLSHCIEAAVRTVVPTLLVHALHSHFLTAGNSSQPMYYVVRRLRDGSSFATRMVVAQQDGHAVFVATVSFHKKELGGLRHQPTMPIVPAPSTLQQEHDGFADILKQVGVSPKFKENLSRKTPDEKLMAIRYVVPRGTLTAPVKSTSPQYAWMRSAKLGGGEGDVDDMNVHLLTAAFMTDFTLALAPFLPHGFPNMNTQMIVSLDHSIYFHASFRVDEWWLYEVWSTWADHNRGMCHGRIWTSDGVLAMTVQQEVLIRMKPEYVSVSKI